MEKEILKKIKEDIADTKKVFDTNFEELEALKQDEKVKRYMHLMNLKKDLETCVVENNPTSIAAYEYKTYVDKVTQTNKIWFYIGDYNKAKFNAIYNAKTNMPGNFLVYVDLENENIRRFVLENEKADFEKSHDVIYSKEKCDWKTYYKLREQFYVDAVFEGEESAKQKIFKKEQ